MAKFLKHLNLQICKYWYIFTVGSEQKLRINQLKTLEVPKLSTSGFLQQPILTTPKTR